MIVFINPIKSNPSKGVWRFIVSYYDEVEKEHIEKIRGLSKLKYGKYAFTMTYIEWYGLCKDWERKTGWKACLHAEDFYLIYYVHPIKVKKDRRDRDLNDLIALDGDNNGT